MRYASWINPKALFAPLPSGEGNIVAMHKASDLEIERVLIELDQMCDAFEQRGWLLQAAEAEQLYANIHRRIGRAMPHQRVERLMRELAAVETPPGRATGFR